MNRLAGLLLIWPAVAFPQATVELPRAFSINLPLFPDSAWTEAAAAAPVLGESAAQVLATYKVLCGDTSNLRPIGSPPYTDWPFPDVNLDDYAIPIFSTGTGSSAVTLCDYEGAAGWPGPKWPDNVEGGPVSVPDTASLVRPAGPEGTDADGHLVLVDPSSQTSFDFWQATTQRVAPCASIGGGVVGAAILEAGAADYFPLTGNGSNWPGLSSARAMGVPLLAGMILPEDIMAGSIDHALAVAVPGPRNLSPDPHQPVESDWSYPASTTETDFYSVDPAALAAGQRVRAKATLVDDAGSSVNEGALTPITRMFLTALRDYGAYVVDNAGGFTFYAEDIHTAVLQLSNAAVNALIGRPEATPLPPEKTRWQLVIETLNLDLEGIPFAFGSCAAAASTVSTANFEIVVGAAPPRVIFADGFSSGSTAAWSGTSR